MGQLYDVVLFGAQEGHAPRDIAQRIAAAFSISASEALKLVGGQSAMVFKEAISLEDAEHHLQLLSQTGAKANYRPTMFSGKTLELVPMDKPKQVCPECGHGMEHEEGARPPEVCSNCGLVFAKYQEVKKRKQEEQDVRNRLRKIHAMRQDMEEKQQQMDAEEQRRRALEEQIRREMGLPALVDKPWKLWSSAAATLFLGVGVGVLGGMLIATPPGRLDATDTLSMGSGPGAAGNGSIEDMIASTAGQLNLNGLPIASADAPEAAAFQQDLQTQGQLLALSSSIIEQTTLPASDIQSLGAGLQPNALPASGISLADNQAIQAHLPSDTEQLSDYLSDDGDDAEWEHFILANLNASLEAGAVSDARRLANHLKDPETLTIALARVAASHARLGQTSEADALLASLIESIGKSPSPMRRVELLTGMAPVFGEMDLPATAAHLISKATESARTIAPAGEQADAWARIALAQANIGLGTDAQRSIRKALQALQGPMEAEQRVQAATYLAEVFSHLGAKDNAVKILAKAQISAEDIGPVEMRDRALEIVANGWATLGQLKKVVATSDTLSSPQQRDACLLRILQKQAFSPDELGLASLAESIRSDLLRARAYGYVAVASRDRRLSADYLQRAQTISDSIPATLPQAILRAEIARFMLRTAHTQQGRALFSQVESEVQALSAGSGKDVGWARLVEHRARALEIAQAQSYLNRVKSQQVQEKAHKDLLRVSQAIRYLPSTQRIGSS